METLRKQKKNLKKQKKQLLKKRKESITSFDKARHAQFMLIPKLLWPLLIYEEGAERSFETLESGQ